MGEVIARRTRRACLGLYVLALCGVVLVCINTVVAMSLANSDRRPNILLVLPFLTIWLFFHFRRRIETRSIVILILVLFVGVVVPILPVTVRNHIVADDFVPISSQGGVNLYLGNNSAAEGLTMMMPEK